MVAVSDATGAGVATSKYSVDGASASLASEFGFTGQLWLPSVQLYYYKARMYSPQLGRFMQRDPLGYAAGLNLYAYAGGDPVNARDPSGLAWECIGGYLYRMDPKPTSMPDDALKSKLAEVAVSGHYEIPPCVQAPTLVVGAAPNPNQGGAGNGGAQGNKPGTQVCTGKARALGNSGSLIGKQGAIPGTIVQPGTAAVIPSQFGLVDNGTALIPYTTAISGTVGRLRFSGVSDVIGGKTPIPGMNVRAAMQVLNPGLLVIELYGQPDQGVTDASITVSAPLNCPTGTAPSP